MKRTFTILTFLVVAVAIMPRPTFGQQYAWVPVYSDAETTEVAEFVPGETGFATYLGGDDEDLGGKTAKGSSKGKSAFGIKSPPPGSWMSRTYVGVEYLQWYNKGRSLPALVTGGNPTTTAFTAAGVLPAAPVLFGGQRVGDELRAGARLTFGLWLDDCKNSAIVLRAFGTEGDTTQASATSTGGSILAVPFTDQGAGSLNTPNALVLAYAGGVTPVINAQGSYAAKASNDIFGGDLLGRTLISRGHDYRFDLLGGYQMTRIDDDLELATTLNRVDLGSTFTTQDLFDVENEYHAGTIGLMGEFYKGPLTVKMMGKLGIGNMNQRVAISGSNTVNGGAATGGGIFAQDQAGNGGPTYNIGNYSRDVLVWSPEASIKATYCVSDRLSLSVGYTFLYWTRVALAGDQMDTNVNRDVLFGGAYVAGGGNNPAFAFRDTDFWVQTIDLGAVFSY